jgi:putative transposase
LETEKLALDEAKASAKRLRDKGKSLNNEAILQEVIEREATLKKNRKQRQKEEQAYKQSPSLPPAEARETESIEVKVEEETDRTFQVTDLEVWDLEQMKEDGSSGITMVILAKSFTGQCLQLFLI